MKEGISETMQDAVPASQEDGSTLLTAPEERTLQNEAVWEDESTQSAFSRKNPEDQTMQHGLDMVVDKHSSKETDQGSQLEAAEPTIELICQQIGDDKIDNQVLVSEEGKDAVLTPGKSAEGDGGLPTGNGTLGEESIEEIDIQEDDLIKTVMEVFEARHLAETRPIPVLVKGKEVDLVQLSFQVRACGGYNQVTLWSSISKSLGFGQECGPLLKLVYVKYLKGIENRRLVANQAMQGSLGVLKRENEESVKEESARSQSKNRGVTSTRKRNSEEGPTIIDNSAVDSSAGLSAESSSESLVGVLEWVKRLALNPGDPKKGQGARVSRWSEAWAGKCETLAVRLREALWKKHEYPLYDFSPAESQDQELEGKKRRGRKARRLSS